MKSQIIISVFITTLVLLLPQKLHATPAVAGFVRIREVQALSQFVIAHGASELSRVLLLHFLQVGGGFGEATDASAATQQVQTERQERGGSITIAWSENNDELSGFSNKTGRWQKLKIEPQEKIQPNCVEFVGAVRLKDGIAAYSGETGTWDVVHLPETSTVMPAVSPDVAQFKEGEHFYAFSAATGRWTSPTDPAMKTLTIQYLSPKHIHAAELHARLIDWMQTVPASEVNGSLQWLDGVLSLLPRTKEWQEAAEAEVAKLDVPGAGNGASGMPGGHPAGGAGYPGGVGGFGPAGFGGLAGAAADSLREVSSNSLMITWSETNDEIRGFSNSKGEWDVLKVEKLDRIIPVVGDEVAAVRIGDSMAAFSAAKAQWDVIKLSEGSTAVPVVFDGYVKVEDNGHLYTFADAKGQWTSPTDPEFQQFSKEIKLANGDFASLRNQFDEWLKSLPRYKGRAVIVMFNVVGHGKETVARIDANRKSLANEVEAKLVELSASSLTGDAVSLTEPRGNGVNFLESQIAKLRDELQELELTVRDSSGISRPPSISKEEHLRQLRIQVGHAFDTRQQLQRLEAERMKLKLTLIETNLNVREKAREAIIERRVSELIDGKIDRSDSQTSNHKPGDPEILFFMASYASPCQQMQPTIDRLKEDNLAIKQIDITLEPELARRHKIDRIPTFILMADGKEISRLIGLTTEQELRNAFSDATRNRAANRASHKWRSIISGEAVSVPASAEIPYGAPAGLAFHSADNNRVQWPQPQEIVKELRRFRDTVSGKLDSQKQSNLEIEKWSKPLEQLKSEGHLSDNATDAQRESNLDEAKRQLTSIQDSVKKAKHDWAYAWSAYQSKLRLLKLDVEEARLAFDAKSADRDRMQKLADKGVVTTQEFQKASSEVSGAEIQLKRAEELLKLYADIEAQEPDLNPDSLSAEK